VIPPATCGFGSHWRRAYGWGPSGLAKSGLPSAATFHPPSRLSDPSSALILPRFALLVEKDCAGFWEREKKNRMGGPPAPFGQKGGKSGTRAREPSLHLYRRAGLIDCRAACYSGERKLMAQLKQFAYQRCAPRRELMGQIEKTYHRRNQGRFEKKDDLGGPTREE